EREKDNLVKQKQQPTFRQQELYPSKHHGKNCKKNLGQKGKMSRNNKQKSQLNRVERPEGGAPFCDEGK
ncbi:unnamed protein product, partial [Rangifer tarandus platyrhynchus]